MLPPPLPPPSGLTALHTFPECGRTRAHSDGVVFVLLSLFMYFRFFPPSRCINYHSFILGAVESYPVVWRYRTFLNHSLMAGHSGFSTGLFSSYRQRCSKCPSYTHPYSVRAQGTGSGAGAREAAERGRGEAAGGCSELVGPKQTALRR